MCELTSLTCCARCSSRLTRRRSISPSPFPRPSARGPSTSPSPGRRHPSSSSRTQTVESSTEILPTEATSLMGQSRSSRSTRRREVDREESSGSPTSTSRARPSVWERRLRPSTSVRSRSFPLFLRTLALTRRAFRLAARRKFTMDTTNAALYDAFHSDPLYKNLPFLLLVPNPQDANEVYFKKQSASPAPPPRSILRSSI